ncbi:hypothetical protein BKM09_032400 (plasmid) [Pseudomonas amygdali pv. morsprunorum]|nr:hypothetical protein BKM09_032400 [Pseudomonas amygdali pv. morsprunorum]
MGVVAFPGHRGSAWALAGKQASELGQQARHGIIVWLACEGKTQRQRIRTPRLIVGMINEYFDVFSFGKSQPVSGSMSARAHGKPQQGQWQLFANVFHQISSQAPSPAWQALTVCFSA